MGRRGAERAGLLPGQQTIMPLHWEYPWQPDILRAGSGSEQSMLAYAGCGAAWARVSGGQSNVEVSYRFRADRAWDRAYNGVHGLMDYRAFGPDHRTLDFFERRHH